MTLNGAGFTGVTAVRFGATNATSYIVDSANTIRAVSPVHAAGVVNVTVTTGAGTSSEAAGNQFTFVADLPVVTGIAPNEGPATGGTAVVISGLNFTGATAVSFGGTPATSYTVVTDTTINAISPAHIAGTVDVIVTTPAGASAVTTADRFTFTSGTAPVVTGLSPNTGPTAGGTTVAITGTGFTGALAVQFGGTAATSFVVNSGTSITATAPAHAAGTINVIVTTAGGASAANTASQYTYSGTLPVVTSLSPTTGPVAGGTVVTITGTGFTGATSVTFGGTAATSFTVDSSTSIRATSPAKPAGPVQVVVTTPAGASATGAASTFTYTGGPIVTGLAPDEGPLSGGTVVVITGTEFTGATAVTFGGVNATSFTVNSATQITAVAPPRTTPGDVFVRVTTPAATSGDVAAATFTYTETGATHTYTLVFRWTLATWLGANGIAISAALSGADNNTATNDVSDEVTAIYRWNAGTQRWEAHFPGSENVPGANDFSTFETGRAYFFAIQGPGNVTWVVLRGSSD